MDTNELVEKLRELANNDELLWNVARKAIEDELIDFRDSGLSFPYRNNGLVVKYQDGKSSTSIRMGPERAVQVGFLAIAEYLEKEQ